MSDLDGFFCNLVQPTVNVHLNTHAVPSGKSNYDTFVLLCYYDSKNSET